MRYSSHLSACLQVLLSLRCFVSDLQALPAPPAGSVCAALRLCAMDKASADACATCLTAHADGAAAPHPHNCLLPCRG